MHRIFIVLWSAAAACAGLSPQNLKSAGALGGRIVLKDPIDKKCRELGVSDCSNVTEGILLFVESNPSEGKERLRVAANSNSPESLHRLAKAIVAVGDIPGTADYMGLVLSLVRHGFSK